MPLVSIIVSVYNAAPYLREAINSLLEQTLSDFELIILNDGSTDESASIIKSFSDKRIIFIDDSHNAGACARFNAGIEMSRGKYIAQMGADDKSLPQRLECQIKVLEANNDIGLCGSIIQLFKNQKNIAVWGYPETQEGILVRQFTFPGLAHTALVMRKKVLVDNQIFFSTSCFPAEDYEIFYNLLKVTKGYNVQKKLVLYRMSDNQITATKKQLVKKNTNMIRQRYLGDLGVKNENSIYDYHCDLLYGKWPQNKKFFYKAFGWFEYLLQMNSKVKLFNDKLFKSELSRILFAKSYVASNRNFNGYALYKKSSFYGHYKIPSQKRFKLVIKNTLFQR